MRSPEPLLFDNRAQLRGSFDRAARRLTRAVDAPSPDGALRVPLDRIEAVREELLADQSQVEIMNYGAGSRNSTHTREEMRTGWVTHNSVADVCRRAASKPRKALTLYSLVREFTPRRGLELGTCLGISCAYMATAMQQSGRGRMTTLEGAPSFGEIARGNFQRLGLDNIDVRVGRFADTLPEVLAAGQLDFAFVDGHHDELATIAYHQQLLPHMAGGAVLVFDDIAWSEGMARAWADIAADPSNRVSANLGAMGVCVLRRGAGTPFRD